MLYLDIEWVPQGFHQKAYSLIPHWVEVFMDGLASEHFFPCNFKLHIWITGPYGQKMKEKPTLLDKIKNNTNKVIISDAKLTIKG